MSAKNGFGTIYTDKAAEEQAITFYVLERLKKLAEQEAEIKAMRKKHSKK